MKVIRGVTSFMGYQQMNLKKIHSAPMTTCRRTFKTILEI